MTTMRGWCGPWRCSPELANLRCLWLSGLFGAGVAGARNVCCCCYCPVSRFTTRLLLSGGGGGPGRVPSEDPCGWRWVLLSCPRGGAPSY